MKTVVQLIIMYWILSLQKWYVGLWHAILLLIIFCIIECIGKSSLVTCLSLIEDAEYFSNWPSDPIGHAPICNIFSNNSCRIFVVKFCFCYRTEQKSTIAAGAIQSVMNTNLEIKETNYFSYFYYSLSYQERIHFYKSFDTVMKGSSREFKTEFKLNQVWL